MPLICLPTETYERIARYADVAGIPVEQAASEAIDKWYDATGELVMFVMEKQRKRRAIREKTVILMPSALELVSSH